MKIRQRFICPLELVSDMLKGKWKPIILWRLRLGPTSPSKLQQDIENITEKMLIQQLAELIESGFVFKKIYVGYPLKVHYGLTEQGEKILGALAVMQEVGEGLIQEGYLQKSK